MRQMKENAIQVCSEYDSDESEAVRILRDCEIKLELVASEDATENVIGVVAASQSDAEIMENDWDIYSDVMDALGEVCSDIQHDRVVVRT